MADSDGTSIEFVGTIRRLSCSQSVEEVIAVATPFARRLVSADGITFVLRDGDLCHYADEDAISPLWKDRRFPMKACISGWCMLNHKAVVIRDIYQDERIPADLYRPTFVRSLAMVPVNKDNPVGAMGAYWKNKRNVSAKQLSLLQTMADAASLAIRNVQTQHKEDVADRMRQDYAHRIKNIFTVALALVNQTRASTAQDYRQALTERLVALERAHSIMFQSSDGLVDLRLLVNQLLSAYASDGQLEVESQTVEVPLSAPEATDFALVLNELACNAIKYGALSVPEGKVTVSCEAGVNRLRLDWRESGGPPVEPPSQNGLGTTLIKGIVVHNLEGKAELRYPPGGFECELVLPLGKKY